MADLGELRDSMRRFSERRGLGQTHDPKSLLLALHAEAGQLAELLSWLPAAGVAAAARDEPLRSRVAEELADVLLCLVRLADVLGVDLERAATGKLAAADRDLPTTLWGARLME